MSTWTIFTCHSSGVEKPMEDSLYKHFIPDGIEPRSFGLTPKSARDRQKSFSSEIREVTECCRKKLWLVDLSAESFQIILP